jgi:hypothetical protein
MAVLALLLEDWRDVFGERDRPRVGGLSRRPGKKR